MAWYEIDKRFECIPRNSLVGKTSASWDIPRYATRQQDMQDHEDPIVESWEKLKKVWKETSEETLAQRKQQNKAWMSHHISKIALKRKKKENLHCK